MIANGGHLPRSGLVTVSQFVTALHDHLGVPRSLGSMLARVAMDRLGRPDRDGVRMLDLSTLTEHGLVEHDGSHPRGDARTSDAAAIRALFARERLPVSVKRRQVGWGSLLLTAANLAVMGNVPFLPAAKRARAAARESLAAAPPGSPFAPRVLTEDGERGCPSEPPALLPGEPRAHYHPLRGALPCR